LAAWNGFVAPMRVGGEAFDRWDSKARFRTPDDALHVRLERDTGLDLNQGITPWPRPRHGENRETRLLMADETTPRVRSTTARGTVDMNPKCLKPTAPARQLEVGGGTMAAACFQAPRSPSVTVTLTSSFGTTLPTGSTMRPCVSLMISAADR
jgi:hypothetical protein